MKIQFEMIEKSLQKKSIPHTPILTLTNYSSDDFHQLNGSLFFKMVFSRKKMVNLVNSPPKKCFVFLIYSICFLNGCCFCWILCWHILQCTLGMFSCINSSIFKKKFSLFSSYYVLTYIVRGTNHWQAWQIPLGDVLY